ncbi:MAG: SUMF1/EgtB/PvdO family nonheme iron enzyme [Paludibacteraceae bacterium]|nr:SUMF1/EgtB/PvdO family nonheme iron enzyme [Paludibacteraceae bacterium]
MMKITLKYLSFFFLFLLMPVTLVSQNEGLSVKRLNDVSTIKQYARTQPRYDANNEYSALVLVQVLTDVKIDFTGAYLLGDVEKKASEYWVYMAAGAKSLEVHCTGFEKLNVVFGDVSQGAIPSLKSKCTYELVINVPRLIAATTQAPKRQFFKFRVTPADAIVEVDVDGRKDMWHVSDGVASKPLNYGSYRYTISANRYHTEYGEFVVSDTQTEKTIELRPKFGYLYISSKVSQGAYVYATHMQTGARQSLGTVPVNGKDLDAGSYSILIQKDKYKDYTEIIQIEEGETNSLAPNLEANYVELTLTTSGQSDMYIDGQKLGTGRWKGTLELGEYSIETRQAGHESAYTTIRVVPQSAGQTIALNNPIPIYGSMVLTTSPADAAVYVDGKKVGTSPVIVNELLIGSHSIRVEKDGYDQQEKTVQIIESQETILELMLNKSIEKAPIIVTVNGVSFNMIKIEGGTFMMGATPEQAMDAYHDEKPVHSVTLSDYYIGETEVTQELWYAVMGNNPSNFKGVQNPVEQVSWHDCQTFIKKLNRLTGRRFRLPTEAEWEYAARGGQKSNKYKYAGGNVLSDLAWYRDNSENKTHPVKKNVPNELGLYDMSGNVYEWCSDWFDAYSNHAQVNPEGPSSNLGRVFRGGSWGNDAKYCRVSFRYYNTPTDRACNLGLRLALQIEK